MQPQLMEAVLRLSDLFASTSDGIRLLSVSGTPSDMILERFLEQLTHLAGLKEEVERACDADQTVVGASNGGASNFGA